MTQNNEADRFMVMLLPVRAVSRISLRVAPLAEALAYSRSFNIHSDQTKRCAAIAPDLLPDTPVAKRLAEGSDGRKPSLQAPWSRPPA